MYKKSFFAALALLSLTLLFFQNCSDPKFIPSEKPEEIEEVATEEQVVVDENVPEPETGPRIRVASADNVIGPDFFLNNSVINLADHGFDENGPDPHIMISQRDFNVGSVDGNTVNSSLCAFTKLSKLEFQVECHVGTDGPNAGAQSSFDWIAIQSLGRLTSPKMASATDVSGPDAALNLAQIDLNQMGFESGLETHFIVTQRNYNQPGVDGDTMDASLCGYEEVQPLVYEVNCWVSTDNLSGTIQSSFDWFAIQISADDDATVVASGADQVGPDVTENLFALDLSTVKPEFRADEFHILTSENNFNAAGVDGNTMDASFCGYDISAGTTSFTATCWASTNNSGGTDQSSFDWLAIQP